MQCVYVLPHPVRRSTEKSIQFIMKHEHTFLTRLSDIFIVSNTCILIAKYIYSKMHNVHRNTVTISTLYCGSSIYWEMID